MVANHSTITNQVITHRTTTIKVFCRKIIIEVMIKILYNIVCVPKDRVVPSPPGPPNTC
ncbi:hypothetical protein Lalb_Chr01g0010121 [Lupinus albus]|uniref:Uncharacterized protein n=1 Tax=Lupinus albus TaxID=3870 RepID=A0A6A4R4X2_LUPAL|nr:hypothetical protein Lalb_Chr01g0010121 [Lupinus albus]